MAGHSAAQAIEMTQAGIHKGAWFGREDTYITNAQERYAECYQSLLTLYDMIVIDAPSLQRSFDGIMLAAKADAAVLVVEAETTPPPVVERLHRILISSGATVAGVVMNKRRYYIPEKIYQRL